jgi:hypothetical protein
VRTRSTVIAAALGAYLIGLGMLAGVVLDRMHYDRQRAEVLSRYEEALRQWRGYLMTLEKSGPAS